MHLLLVRAGALGDLLLLRPAVAALRRAGHRVHLLAPEGAASVLVGPGDGEVEAALPWEAADTARLLGGRPPSGALGPLLREVDVVIAWTRSADLVSALRSRAGRVLQHDPAPPPGGDHAALWLSRPLRELGVEPLCGPPPVFLFTEAERAAAERLAAPLPSGFLAVHPGSGSPAKTWADDRFVALVGELSPERPWLLVLGPAEADPPSPLLRLPRAVPAHCLHLRILAALIARAGLFVGNDSGVSHLAAAAGAPTLALFGPTDPACWSPLGPKVEVLRSPHGTMKDLDLAAVLAAAERLAKQAR